MEIFLLYKYIHLIFYHNKLLKILYNKRFKSEEVVI